jgi:hypothetical protein
VSLNIYEISQDINDDYDTYDHAVVVAASEEDARKMFPGSPDGTLAIFNYGDGTQEQEKVDRTWAEPQYVSVEYVGVAADKYTTPCVICASFNAG